MKREEAIKILKSKMDGHTDTSYKWAETVRMAIIALKQEPILDKVRAEIEQAVREETVVDCSGGEYERTVSTIDLDDVLEILDKYRESEE